MSETRKLGFGSIAINPGELRNDLFITIVRGNFDRGKPGTSSRNIEVVLSVCDGDSREVCGGVLASSQGGPSSPALLHHNNSPTWEETFRLDIDIDQFHSEGTHLKLEYYHCSLKERLERKMLGFSWLELMRGNGTVIRYFRKISN